MRSQQKFLGFGTGGGTHLYNLPACIYDLLSVCVGGVCVRECCSVCVCVSATTTNSTLGTIEKWMSQWEREKDGESDRESSMRSTRIASFVVAPNIVDTTQLQIQIHFECVLWETRTATTTANWIMSIKTNWILSAPHAIRILQPQQLWESKRRKWDREGK